MLIRGPIERVDEWTQMCREEKVWNMFDSSIYLIY